MSADDAAEALGISRGYFADFISRQGTTIHGIHVTGTQFDVLDILAGAETSLSGLREECGATAEDMRFLLKHGLVLKVTRQLYDLTEEGAKPFGGLSEEYVAERKERYGL